jgi:hypothetical protein
MSAPQRIQLNLFTLHLFGTVDSSIRATKHAYNLYIEAWPLAASPLESQTVLIRILGMKLLSNPLLFFP